MPLVRKKINRVSDLNQYRDVGREINVLTSDIGGNAPAIIKDLADAREISAAEALEFELQFDRLVRGDASLLENVDSDAVRRFIAIMKARADKADKVSESWEKDKVAFMENAYSNAEKRMGSTDDRVRTALKASKKYQGRIATAKANMRIKRQYVEQRMKTDEKVTIVVPERHMTGRGGKPIPDPYIVNIEGIAWKLGFGEQKVPKIVADRFRQMQRDAELNKQRKRIMNQQMDYAKAERQMAALGR